MKNVPDGWKLTDADNYQYGKQISEKVFAFKEFDRFEFYHLTDTQIETLSFDDEDYFVELEIDLDKYTPEEIEKAINGYYNNMQQLVNYYGDDSNWIIAECIFEGESGLY